MSKYLVYLTADLTPVEVEAETVINSGDTFIFSGTNKVVAEFKCLGYLMKNSNDGSDPSS